LSQLRGQSRDSRRVDTVSPVRAARTSHWLEGGILTGTLTAVVGVLFFLDARDEPNGPSIVLLPLAVALPFLAGFTPGALIGSLIPKE
jgi:hypothetical protein